MASDLPAGWEHTPTVPAKSCSHCGHEEPAKPGTLRSPAGREWPLVGNRGPSQERQMVRAIVTANEGATHR